MSNPPGLMLPTQKSFAPGTGNPRDSAIASMKQTDQTQQQLNAAVTGGKGRRSRRRRRHRRRRGGATQQVTVPQFQMQYTPQGGPGTNPNDQIKATSSTSMQSAAWSANDALATKKGGRKHRRHTRRHRRR